MEIKGIAGLRTVADGAMAWLRFGNDSELIVGQAHGKYTEAVRRGNVYQAVTAATGVAPGTALGTTGAYTVFNPPQSGVLAVVLRASMGYVSGTMGAGVVTYNANINPVAAVTTGTEIRVINLRLGSGSSVNAQGNKVLAFTTSTLPATPAILRPFASIGASLATTAVQPWQIMEDVDGEFIVTPGAALTLHATAAAGTTPLVVFGMTWEEIKP